MSCQDFFLQSIESLSPENLLDRALVFDEIHQTLQIDDCCLEIKNGLYVVGFGKAVLGLGAFISKKFPEFIKKGILSIPMGTSEIEEYKIQIDICKNANIKILEGAKDNLPDNESHKAAMEIVDMVSNLSKDDVVLVLISGGGSALLPFPVKGVSLEEKLSVVRALSRAGASITELNTVRKALSGVKGGKLAELIQPAKVFSLVLSDIIGDPLDFIASGPTVSNNDEPHAAINIIEKYKLLADISNNVVEVLKHNTNKLDISDYSKLCVVGNNEKALQHIHTHALQVYT